MTEHKGLVEALVAAQAEFPTIPKAKTAKVPTKSGGEYRYQYADLADILDAVTPILVKHGIAQVQRLDIREGQQVLCTEVLFQEEKIESVMLLPIEGMEPQKVGSVLTYYRRYALQAVLGIVAEKDDDAADTTHVRQPAARPAAPERKPFAAAPYEDRGQHRYRMEGYDVEASEWISAARVASHHRHGQALLDWWEGYRETRATIYQRHEAHREVLAQLSAQIKERGHAAALEPNGGARPAHPKPA